MFSPGVCEVYFFFLVFYLIDLCEERVVMSCIQLAEMTDDWSEYVEAGNGLFNNGYRINILKMLHDVFHRKCVKILAGVWSSDVDSKTLHSQDCHCRFLNLFSRYLVVQQHWLLEGNIVALNIEVQPRLQEHSKGPVLCNIIRQLLFSRLEQLGADGV